MLRFIFMKRKNINSLRFAALRYRYIKFWVTQYATKMAANSGPVSATARIQPKKQTLDDAYAAPANFLEIDVTNPEVRGVGKKRYTDYEVKMKVRFTRILRVKLTPPSTTGVNIK